MRVFDTTRKKKMILAIEDSPTQARFINSLLKEDEVYFVVAIDGEMGLRMANQLHPDLIVLDLEMPRISGQEVFRELKKNTFTRDIPVIIFTHHNNPEFKDLPIEDGPVEFIPKDVFARAVLMETLRQLGFIGCLNPA